MSRRTGKWNDPSFPHDGWEFVKMKDLGEPLETCEMCEAHLIRYVHVMRHPRLQTTLEVGCICAADMSGDRMAEESRRREKGFKKLILRRENFFHSPKWVLRYNPDYDSYLQYLNTPDGFHISVWGKPDGTWYGKVVSPNQVARYSKERYESIQEVKEACFKVMENIKEKA